MISFRNPLISFKNRQLPFEINNLYKNNHIIGLHSHNHPTNINILSKRDQLKEYRQNINSLTKIIKSSVKLSSMSHPCGIYNFNSMEEEYTENLNILTKQTVCDKNTCLEILKKN